MKIDSLLKVLPSISGLRGAVLLTFMVKVRQRERVMTLKLITKTLLG